eukprot:GILJ01004346.1.p2 GENE.GILJ01004346.1~~GILJ01004346.1.p2  ORF type:complete len:232 (+),score=8.46 GILJ01004346.1:1078-1773(+)
MYRVCHFLIRICVDQLLKKRNLPNKMWNYSRDVSLSFVLQPAVKVTIEDCTSFFSKDPGLPAPSSGVVLRQSPTLGRSYGALECMTKFQSPDSQQPSEGGFRAQFSNQNPACDPNTPLSRPRHRTCSFPLNADEIDVHSTLNFQLQSRKRSRAHFTCDSDSDLSPSFLSERENASRRSAQRNCGSCGVMQTPRWRRCENKQWLCNACGLKKRSRATAPAIDLHQRHVCFKC